MSFQKILCPRGFSPGSPAMRLAIEIANDAGAELVLTTDLT